MASPFRGFGAIFYKETLHVRRDFGTLFFSLIIPAAEAAPEGAVPFPQ